MRIADAIIELQRRFPRHAEEVAAWADGYARALGHLDATRLAECLNRTLDAWAKSIPPKPADFAANVPARQRLSDGAPPPEGGGARTRRAHAERDRLVRDTIAAYADHIAAAASRIGIEASALSWALADVLVRGSDVVHEDGTRERIEGAWEIAQRTLDATRVQVMTIRPEQWLAARELAESRLRMGVQRVPAQPATAAA
jgi:hypothetical protein